MSEFARVPSLTLLPPRSTLPGRQGGAVGRRARRAPRRTMAIPSDAPHTDVGRSGCWSGFTSSTPGTRPYGARQATAASSRRSSRRTPRRRVEIDLSGGNPATTRGPGGRARDRREERIQPPGTRGGSRTRVGRRHVIARVRRGRSPSGSTCAAPALCRARVDRGRVATCGRCSSVWSSPAAQRYVLNRRHQGDGTLKGAPNPRPAALGHGAHPTRPVVASGGVASLDDVAALRELVPLGWRVANHRQKRLYAGAFTLPECAPTSRAAKRRDIP